MRLLAATAACSSAAHPAAAEQLFGSLSVQYQQVEQRLRFLDADSTLRDTRVKREFFLQNYELNYTAPGCPADTYFLRVTGDGWISSYGCCGK